MKITKKETREESVTKQPEPVSEELFSRIQKELATTLQSNMSKIENEIQEIKNRQSQIA